jgi:hypothetical protein
MRHHLLPVWGCALILTGAVALNARAGEVPAVPATTDGTHAEGTLTFCHKHCYDPCEPVGPIRRFFRHVFLHPCPPPCPPVRSVVIAPPVVGVVPMTPPLAVPAAPVPPPPIAPAPPSAAPPAAFPSAGMGRPVPFPPNTSDSSRFTPEPSDNSRLTPEPATGSSYRTLPSPVPQPPIRLDRIASTGDQQTNAGVTIYTRTAKPSNDR